MTNKHDFICRKLKRKLITRDFRYGRDEKIAEKVKKIDKYI